MVDVKELNIREIRIGNWVKYGNANANVVIPDFPAQVNAITLFGELDFSNHKVEIKVPIKHCAGIPITPEILEKAGFSKEREGVYCDRWAFEIHIRYDIFLLYHFEESEGNTWLIREIKYVHELQNIYYLVEQTELNIQL